MHRTLSTKPKIKWKHKSANLALSKSQMNINYGKGFQNECRYRHLYLLSKLKRNNQRLNVYRTKKDIMVTTINCMMQVNITLSVFYPIKTVKQVLLIIRYPWETLT